MLKILEIRVNGSNKVRYTNDNLSFSYIIDTDIKDAIIEKAIFSLNNWKKEIKDIRCDYDGERLEPFKKYELKVEVFVGSEKAELTKEILTSRLDLAWKGDFITDPTYTFTEKGDPKVMEFKKDFSAKDYKACYITSTALGNYILKLNGERISNDYFAPGFTSYPNFLQYQTYDITDLVKDENTLEAIVSGWWAVGPFTYGLKNRITADKEYLLLDIILVKEDGSFELIGTDNTWDVTLDSEFLSSGIYSGETFDARGINKTYHKAEIQKPKTVPKEIICEYGEKVTLHEEFKPISCVKSPKGELIYKFEQNFAGIVKLHIKNAKAGQVITVHHAEVLWKDELCLRLLRGAKATIEYICKDDEQDYMPTFTYMGFQYVGITGIEAEDIEVTAYAMYSNMDVIGKFETSNKDLNRLNENIVWSAKSNFIDIPTDCPQRDERMGWTGDIGLFSDTAVFNFDTEIFLNKWLKDMRAEQNKGGGFPNIIPVQGYGFPLTMPRITCDFWGDACIFVPLALYYQTGNINFLKDNYEAMKKYNLAEKKWSSYLSFGKHRYIFHTISMFHFGDWVVPGVDSMGEWQKRHKWTATASFANTSRLLSIIAKILGNEEDSKYYYELYKRVSDAYESILTDGNGKLYKEFQTAYVLPLAFGMFSDEAKPKALENLVKLIENDEYTVRTGFPGTPFILFSLCDNGRSDVAYKMLLNDKCPSWLFPVSKGATTTWERWDALKADGSLNFAEEDGTGGMVSFNHYVLGSVGNFMYKRILGLEPLEGGYKKFKVEPILGHNLSYAKGETKTPYGVIKVEWKQEGTMFNIKVTVPPLTESTIILPNGESHLVTNGVHEFSISL